MDLIVGIIGDFREHIRAEPISHLEKDGKGVLHELNVFVNFTRFNVMLIHFMDIFATSEDLRIRLFHFPLQFMSLFRAIEKGFHERGFVAWRGRSTDGGDRGEGPEEDNLRYSMGRATGEDFGGKMSIHGIRLGCSATRASFLACESE